MPVSAAYRAEIEERLGAVMAIRTKSMFGGVGIYSGPHFFAIVYDEMLYFKVDAATQLEYESRGMPPFQPFKDRSGSARYFAVPREVFEDPDSLREWARRSVESAKKAVKPRHRPARKRLR